MKVLTLVMMTLLLHTGTPAWQTDFAKASAEAKQNHKNILLNFSGSDWCLPCIKMHKTIFETDAFTGFATSNLVLVSADFPRLNKHQLPKAQQKQNEELAERYNPEGRFPYTLLLSEDGKLIKAWDGLPTGSPEAFVAEVKAAADGHN